MQAAIRRRQAEGLLAARLRVADPHLDRAEFVVRADAPPELRRLDHGAGALQQGDELRVAAPVDERAGHAAAREGAGEDLRAHRVQAAVAAVEEGRVGRGGEQQRQQLAQPVADRDRPVGAAHPHVHVQAPGVVALRDPAQFGAQPVVVGGVDDPLVEVARPGVRAHRRQRQSHPVDQLEQPQAALALRLFRRGEVGPRARSGSRSPRRSARPPPSRPARRPSGRRRRPPRSGAPAPASPGRGSRTPPRARS